MRALAAGLFGLIGLTVVAAEAEPPKPGSTPPSRADAVREDLRYGHVLITASGGPWFPSSSLIPTGIGLSPLGAGGDAQLRVGVGINGFLVAFVDGGAAHAFGDASCLVCKATSIDAALGLSAHFAQGLAVDPWISYSAGYRHTLLSVDTIAGAVSDASVRAVDFTKIDLGFDYFPTPLFGFGPYFGTDVGVRVADAAIYADVRLGLRVTLDPMRAGTKLTVASATAWNAPGALR